MKSLEEWIDEDVRPYQSQSVSWLSQHHFFRDPLRPSFVDSSVYFSPADGVILYQREMDAEDQLVDIKGISYTPQDACGVPDLAGRVMVIGIFMTFFDVHVNRVPLGGRLSYRQIDAIETYNQPMLAVETELLNKLRVSNACQNYLYRNQRVINTIDSVHGRYYVLQIADYDVDRITPFELAQQSPVYQGDRFSMIRYGSQVDLVVPVQPHLDYEFLQPEHSHVEAGIDPLIRVGRR